MVFYGELEMGKLCYVPGRHVSSIYYPDLACDFERGEGDLMLATECFIHKCKTGGFSVHECLGLNDLVFVPESARYYQMMSIQFFLRDYVAA